MDAEKRIRLYSWAVGHFLPINQKKIVFSQFGGNGYGCNPKAIAEEFRKRDLGYDLVWLLKRGTDPAQAGIPKGVRPVVAEENPASVMYELLTAKVWINNIHFNKRVEQGLRKRRGVIYLNTFHGGITIKREGTDHHGFDANRTPSQKELNYRKESEMVDYIVSACDAEDHVLEEFFYGHGEIVHLGDARNDDIINGNPQVEEMVRKKYKVPDGTKILLYAPTFRKGMTLKYYNLDYEKILDNLEAQTGCPWMLLIRLHPRLTKKAKQVIPQSPRIKNASKYLDMQDLLVASDMIVSDYSSCVMDFMLTRKPAFLYVPDLEQYEANRGMYYTMDELPFPYAKTTDELCARMKDFHQEEYTQKVNEFVKKIGYMDDGKSSARVVDFLIEKMKER